jgi:hypothetical protein
LGVEELAASVAWSGLAGIRKICAEARQNPKLVPQLRRRKKASPLFRGFGFGSNLLEVRILLPGAVKSGRGLPSRWSEDLARWRGHGGVHSGKLVCIYGAFNAERTVKDARCGIGADGGYGVVKTFVLQGRP